VDKNLQEWGSRFKNIPRIQQLTELKTKRSIRFIRFDNGGEFNIIKFNERQGELTLPKGHKLINAEFNERQGELTLPKGHKLILVKWIFKIKEGQNKQINCKAYLIT
jgi:hypothetical protein